jgi:hypothetical protein
VTSPVLAVERETAALSRILATLVTEHRALLDWLTGFDDPAQAEWVARRSYWHQNGFAKLVLRAADDHKVRLHVWPAGENRLGETNPHGHRWSFASTVLAGEGLATVNYAEAATGRPYVRYRYVGDNGEGALTPVGNTCLVQIDEAEVRTRERYVVDTSEVHTVAPLGTSLVATLLTQGRATVEAAPVYCAPGVPVDGPVREIAPEQVRGLIRDVRAACTPAGEGP